MTEASKASAHADVSSRCCTQPNIETDECSLGPDRLPQLFAGDHVTWIWNARDLEKLVLLTNLQSVPTKLNPLRINCKSGKSKDGTRKQR